MKFYLTFGQNHPAKDGWVEIHAADHDEVREFAFQEYGSAWSMLYSEERFNPEFFPLGCVQTHKLAGASE